MEREKWLKGENEKWELGKWEAEKEKWTKEMEEAKKKREKQMPELTDEEIVCFLLSCDRDIEATKTTIEAFFAIKEEYHQLFLPQSLSGRNLWLEEIKKGLKNTQ